jgi:hypothetical protein
VQQQLQLRLRLGIAGQDDRPSVVGTWTSIICTALNFSSTERGVRPGVLDAQLQGRERNAVKTLPELETFAFS